MVTAVQYRSNHAYLKQSGATSFYRDTKKHFRVYRKQTGLSRDDGSAKDSFSKTA